MFHFISVNRQTILQRFTKFYIRCLNVQCWNKVFYCHCFSLSKIDVLLWACYRNSDVNNKSTEVLSRVTNGMSVYVNISVHYKRKSASSKFKA